MHGYRLVPTMTPKQDSSPEKIRIADAIEIIKYPQYQPIRPTRVESYKAGYDARDAEVEALKELVQLFCTAYDSRAGLITFAIVRSKMRQVNGK